MSEISSLEQAVEVFPEIKDFIDYVKQTNGLQTLKLVDGTLKWDHQREEWVCFYAMELKLDRNNPSMWVYFRECQIGTEPFSEPAKGQELLQKLPEIFDMLKKVYNTCFVKNEDIYRYATSEETGGQPAISNKPKI